jgi:hypothetical protein
MSGASIHNLQERRSDDEQYEQYKQKYKQKKSLDGVSGDHPALLDAVDWHDVCPVHRHTVG